MNEKASSIASQIVIFMDRHTKVSQVERCVRKVKSTALIVTLDCSFGRIPTGTGKQAVLKYIGEYGPSDPDARREALHWLRDWSNARLEDGSTAKKQLLYRGVSLWWFLDPWWILRGSVFFPALQDTFRQIDAVLNVIAAESPSQIISFCSNHDFNAGLQSACQARGVRLKLFDPTWTRRKRIGNQVLSWAYLGRCALRALAFRLQSLFGNAAPKQVNRDCILVLTGDNWGRILDRTSGEWIENDSYLHGVLSEIRRHFSVVMTIELNAHRLFIVDRKHKQRVTGNSYKTLEGFLSVSAVARAFSAWLRLRKAWNGLRQRPELERNTRYHGIPVWTLLAERLQVFFSGGALSALLSMESAFNAIASERPKAILTDARMCLAGRALIHAAKSAGVPSLAIEHGFFIPDNAWDFLTESDVAEGQRDPELACPLPDKIMVYGPRDRELMVAGHFPPELIEVTGAPRWDSLPFLKASFDRAEVCQKYRLDPASAVILLATQDHYPAAEQDELFRATCAAAHTIPGMQVVVKLHPLDHTITDTTRRYRSIAEAQGFANVVVLEGRILHELLCVSDVLISLACNSAIEASLIGVPVIIADFFEHGVAESFLRHPALLEVKTAGELVHWTRALLLDPAVQRRAASHRADFIARYCHRPDGLAWRRVSQQIVRYAKNEVSGHEAAHTSHVYG